jgi:hypothetical protein
LADTVTPSLLRTDTEWGPGARGPTRSVAEQGAHDDPSKEYWNNVVPGTALLEKPKVAKEEKTAPAGAAVNDTAPGPVSGSNQDRVETRAAPSQAGLRTALTVTLWGAPKARLDT